VLTHGTYGHPTAPPPRGPPSASGGKTPLNPTTGIDPIRSRKGARMKIKQILLASLAFLTIPATAMAARSVGYVYGQIYQTNSTVTLLDVTVDGRYQRAQLTGLKCIFPSTDSGASIKVTITQGSTASSFIADPSYFQRESNGSGQFMSDWIAFSSGNFADHIAVTLNNTNLGTATVNCWATYSIVPQVE
jgi:hypothetical protein